MYISKIRRITSYFCLFFLVFVLITIFTRLLTRQVFVKKLGANNVFTQIVLFDHKELQEKAENDNEEIAGTTDKKMSIDWKKLYPYNDAAEDSKTVDNNLRIEINAVQKYKNKVYAITKKMSEYTTEMLAGYDYWVKQYHSYKRYIFKQDAEVIHMENGSLTYAKSYINQGDIEEIADSLEQFNGFLDSNNIPFYYVNLGSKVNPYDKKLSMANQIIEYTNENADNLLEALQERNVRTVDMRSLMIEDGLDWEEAFYRTDDHLKNITATWVAGKLAETLNNNNNFHFDARHFDLNNYNVTVYDDFWHGNAAREIERVGCEREPYATVFPKFQTEFEMEIPLKGYKEKGSYQEILFNKERFDAMTAEEADEFATDTAYYSIRWNNGDVLGSIKNLQETENKDKKILVLIDSFSWYLATYLACDVGEIDLIYPMLFDGSIKSYVEKTKPDAVLLMLCERNIEPIDWKTHKSAFDMR